MKRACRALLALVGILATFPISPAMAAAPRRNAVQITVDEVSPSTPTRTTDPAPVTVRLTVVNTTDEAIPGVTIRAVRGDPISNQDALDAALADKTPEPDDPPPITPTRPVSFDLDADATQPVQFTTTTSIVDDHKHICLCANAIYPIVFTAYTTGDDGDDVRLATVATYLPSFYKPVQPVHVSWVWPLIDRPHRLVDDTVFTDDALAGSVQGGRLDRMLQVVEALDRAIPITLVIDPELLDELEVMSTGKYSIRPLSGRPTSPGTGQQAAAGWLDRLAGVLTTRPNVGVSLTPYADPDVQSLAGDELTWSPLLPAKMTTRVTAALAGRELRSDLAWPASGALSRAALDSLAAAGAGTVLLDSASVSPSTSDGIPASVARLRTSRGPVTGALTSAAIQTDVAQAVGYGGTGAAAMPALAAEIAVRATQRPDASQYAVLAPPRYVDPVPDAAIRAIQDTSTAPFATPTAISAVADGRPERVSRLRRVPADTASLPGPVVAGAARTATDLPALSALLAASPNATTLLQDLPQGAQRVTSSAWRPGAGPFGPAVGRTYASALTDRVDSVLNGIRIVRPSSGSYTLGSSDSRLPITVNNTSDYEVEVDVSVSTQNQAPGFTARRVGKQKIPAHSKSIIQIPTKAERSGRIPLRAQLSAPNGTPLGRPVTLLVHTTVFGAVGVIITVVAGGILAAALLVRLGRRIRRNRVRGRRTADRAGNARREDVLDQVTP